MFTYGDGACGDALVPPPEGGDDEIIESAYQSGNKQRPGLVAALCPADEHLCGGGSFREWVFAMHLLDEVFAERDEEEDADDAAEE